MSIANLLATEVSVEVLLVQYLLLQVSAGEYELVRMKFASDCPPDCHPEREQDLTQP
ncbi:MAG: hypothetical protein H8K09_09360 [Nitrospira sp.]|jgi:hypothetical protein|nr:hypothetical protein [Nitrospira sp.]